MKSYERILYLVCFGARYKDGGKSLPGIYRIWSCTNANTSNIEQVGTLKVLGENAYIDNKEFIHIILNDVDQIEGKYLDAVDANTIKQLEIDMRTLGIAEDLITEIIKQANEET